jgi:hypothetical protein
MRLVTATQLSQWRGHIVLRAVFISALAWSAALMFSCFQPRLESFNRFNLVFDLARFDLLRFDGVQHQHDLLEQKSRLLL